MARDYFQWINHKPISNCNNTTGYCYIIFSSSSYQNMSINAIPSPLSTIQFSMSVSISIHIPYHSYLVIRQILQRFTIHTLYVLFHAHTKTTQTISNINEKTPAKLELSACTRVRLLHCNVTHFMQFSLSFCLYIIEMYFSFFCVNF